MRDHMALQPGLRNEGGDWVMSYVEARNRRLGTSTP